MNGLCLTISKNTDAEVNSEMMNVLPLEQLMLSKPDSKIILASDVNNLNIRSVLNQLSFTQLVKVPTRGQKILDVFITNAPNYWKNVKVVKSLVRSDHDMHGNHIPP